MLGFTSNQAKKEGRYYLRFHQTIKRAINFNNQLYKDSKGKDGKQLKIEHPLRVASMTQQIAQQSLFQYHLNWLVGVLHDSKEDDPVFFSQKIDEVLKDLLPDQKSQVLNYIDQLSKDRTLSKGQRKKEQVERMSSLDIVPCYIKIFDKYDNCKRFLHNSVGKPKQELYGYYAVAIICYQKAIQKHEQIKKHLCQEVIDFFATLKKTIFGTNSSKMLESAQKYYSL